MSKEDDSRIYISAGERFRERELNILILYSRTKNRGRDTQKCKTLKDSIRWVHLSIRKSGNGKSLWEHETRLLFCNSSHRNSSTSGETKHHSPSLPSIIVRKPGIQKRTEMLLLPHLTNGLNLLRRQLEL